MNRDFLHPHLLHLDPDEVSDALTRLPDRYFESFSTDDMVKHMTALAALSTDSPLTVWVESVGDGNVQVTVVAMDYPFLLAATTGILAAHGVDIIKGDIFTYAPQAKPNGRWNRDVMWRQWRRKKIVDYFEGRRLDDRDWVSWKESLERALMGMGALLESNPSVAIDTLWRRVSEHLSDHAGSQVAPLSPAQVRFDNTLPHATQLTLTTQDTPFFLFSFCTALAHHGLSVQQLSINTHDHVIEDVFHLTDRQGHKIEDPVALDTLRLSVVFCKQFTYYLNQAPNPYDAITRYEQLIQSILVSQPSAQRLAFLTNPLALADLARVLGASEYLWEDFIRTHYESLEPILGDVPPHTEPVAIRLARALSGVITDEAKQKVVNQFKDQAIFEMDLRHLCQRISLTEMSEQLTELVEAVIQVACEVVMASLVRLYGEPKTIGNLSVQWGVFGLGKLGGVALGYASDIELLMVFSDAGYTDGAHSISNQVFFGELVKELNRFIVAKRSGIFAIDLRLRPYGKDGPLASSVEQFCRYFGRDGDAQLYERLALVRLRGVAGDDGFCRRIECLRDEWVYHQSISDFSSLWDLRKRQHDQKVWVQPNAKFSPGALVDLEYTVQALQVQYGSTVPELKTPRIREALRALQSAGLIEASMLEQLVNGYIFLRRLINGLRVLRGSAEDLNLPHPDQSEFDHLARRMGYHPQAGIGPADQLLIEFETVTAMVRGFLERYFSRESLPSSTVANVADWVLNPHLPSEMVTRIFSLFQRPEKAARNIRLLAQMGEPSVFARLAVLAVQWLKSKPNPDRALNHWERFVRAVPSPRDHYAMLLAQPARLDILLDLFSTSDYLSDLLIRHPDDFYDITQTDHLHAMPRRGALSVEWTLLDGQDTFRATLRRFKHRHVLRIAIQDMTLRRELPVIYRHLSLLAETCVMASLERGIQRLGLHSIAHCFCVLAMGKLGGSELNYSSDIDLIPVLDTTGLTVPVADALAGATELVKSLRDDLAQVTGDGHCYRVDFNLRPFGRSGTLVGTTDALVRYFQDTAAPWEMQALLKMRPLAGDWATGFEVMNRLRPCVDRFDQGVYRQSVREMRERAIQQSESLAVSGCGKGAEGWDIKNGRGGIRDIEFLIQVMVLAHPPGQWIRSTLPAITYLKKQGVLDPLKANDLMTSYMVFRRLEHALQILDNQQTHRLPVDPQESHMLVRQVWGVDTPITDLWARLSEHVTRCHAAFLEGTKG
ncbi:hypothetical protein EBZ35_03155 [bacterium]|nr:hypothetical protein [bacterium]